MKATNKHNNGGKIEPNRAYKMHSSNLAKIDVEKLSLSFLHYQDNKTLLN